MNIKDIIKGNTVKFVEYRKGFLYYDVFMNDTWDTYIFPVPIEDCGDATFKCEDKAIYFMRYIRKALEEGTFVKVN